MNPPTILVAGIGNIFLGDDGFGVAVVRRRCQRACPAHVRLVDLGIRGIDLAYALLEPYELVVLVDIVQRESVPGTVHVIELDPASLPPRSSSMEAHSVSPARAIDLARALGATLPRMVLVGCEPASFGDPDSGAIALSPPVAAAVDVAIVAIDSLISGPPARSVPCTNLA